MKILITGVNGFIGQHLAVALLQRKHQVIGLGRNAKCSVQNITKYYSGSVLDKKKVHNAAKGVDVIIHLAALTAHKDIIDNRFKTLQINLEGTQNILEVFTQSKTAKKIIYSSTGKVYGKITRLPITEDHPANPLNILGKSKLIAEQLIDFYSDNKKTFVICRLFNIYGPKQKDNFLVPTILRQLQSGEINLGDIKAKRDYVYITDVIDALVLSIEKKHKPGLTVYNICSGVGTSALEIVKAISSIKKINYKINSNKSLVRHDEMPEEYGSFVKAKKELGWQPKVRLKEGLQLLLQ